MILHAPGFVAVPDDDPNGHAGVAWHFGNPLGEQRAAMSGCGIVDRSYRRVLRLTGADRVEYLNTLFSQQIADSPTEALNLDPQGRVLHHMSITPLADEVLIDVEPGQYDSLRTYLERMIFRYDVTVSETDLTVISLIGNPVAIDTPGVHKHPAQWPGNGRVDLIGAPDDLTAACRDAQAAGAVPTGLMAWEAERVTALRPEINPDLDEKTIPHEVPNWIGADQAVHLDKGCYRGQETVSRVHNLGRPPRTLVLLQLDGSATRPDPSDPITAGRRTVGRVGTVVDHCDFGPIALGLVKRTAQTSDDLAAGDCAIKVDPETIDRDDSVRPGRAAVNKLRGKTT
ncbi:folate-binding protein [Corynebacterium sp. TAE3-ERU12]|uniref:CAF17-like 4Fe-4S cluster assembly/insertion protein YgfZ n=1 Tax=Corynebacterium sp. TAE3-ERU12 TaxID=2849491 RepID=UPI001C46EA0A|nr:folate-binding protein [Corynebacterium sp. TAE3-ERU12]MBV7295855.1 folate-binding protein [Corynebacterium sp. TAE3-ERU12]